MSSNDSDESDRVDDVPLNALRRMVVVLTEDRLEIEPRQSLITPHPSVGIYWTKVLADAFVPRMSLSMSP